jgi:hypothetical protein
MRAASPPPTNARASKDGVKVSRLLLIDTANDTSGAWLPHLVKVSRNGSAGDWYWELTSHRKIIDRGLAPTRAQARAQALKVAASYALWQPTDSTRSFKGPESAEAP